LIQTLAFWDASALVPLCVEQDASEKVNVWAEQFAIVAWWGARVEVHSAIARLHRLGQLQSAAKDIALDCALVLAAGWREIPQAMLCATGRRSFSMTTP
jgi:predicted nucleic acid-binding protein